MCTLPLISSWVCILSNIASLSWLRNADFYFCWSSAGEVAVFVFYASSSSAAAWLDAHCHEHMGHGVVVAKPRVWTSDFQEAARVGHPAQPEWGHWSWLEPWSFCSHACGPVEQSAFAHWRGSSVVSVLTRQVFPDFMSGGACSGFLLFLIAIDGGTSGSGFLLFPHADEWGTPVLIRVSGVCVSVLLAIYIYINCGADVNWNN